MTLHGFRPAAIGARARTSFRASDAVRLLPRAWVLGRRPAFALLGLPTVSATVNTTGPFGELVARLWDVLPDVTQRLVSRGIYRLTDNQQGRLTFQLHGNGYRFAAGDTVKLELLGRDSPYYRASNGSFTIQLSNLTVSLPTS
jgi:predicted acyl esterase